MLDNPTGWDVRKHGVGYDLFMTSTYCTEMRRRLDYYNGDQFQQDPQYIQTNRYIDPATWNNAMSGFGWDDIRCMLPDAVRNIIIHPVSIPFTELVVNSQQVVYAIPAEGRILKEDSEPMAEDIQNIFNAIYKEADFDFYADQLCKWTGLFGTAFQVYAYDERKRRMSIRNLPPFMVYVDPAAEDPTDIQHPDCFVAIAQIDQGMTNKEAHKPIYQCWWGDRYWYEQDVGQEYKDPGLREKGTNFNPYRDKEGNVVKPIVVSHYAKTDEIYYSNADNTVMLNQRLDRDFTALSSVMEYQGFSIPVAKGITSSEASGQPWSPAALFLLPDSESDLKFIHPLVQLGEFMKTATNKARMFARLKGLDPELVDPETKVQSGVSKAQQRIALIERRETEFPKWVPFEREAYYILSTVWNAAQKKVKLPSIPRYHSPIDDSHFEVQVMFGQLNPTVDPLASTLEKVNRIKSNLNTRAEIIATERRLPLKDAEKVAETIRKTNDEERAEAMEIMRFAEGEDSEEVPPEQQRIGQSGNRPRDLNAKGGAAEGGNVTASSGNTSIPNQKKDF